MFDMHKLSFLMFITIILQILLLSFSTFFYISDELNRCLRDLGYYTSPDIPTWVWISTSVILAIAGSCGILSNLMIIVAYLRNKSVCLFVYCHNFYVKIQIEKKILVLCFNFDNQCTYNQDIQVTLYIYIYKSFKFWQIQEGFLYCHGMVFVCSHNIIA